MLVDANHLLFDVDETSPWHARSAAWMEQQLNGDRRVGIPWESLAAFVRISTHPRASSRPLKPDRAWSLVESWLAAPTVWMRDQVIRNPAPEYIPIYSTT